MAKQSHQGLRWGLALVGALGLSALGAEASACGGCFAPPETVQVVTDHRMVMAIHPDESILWDQFRYTGRPQDFSWILPVRGDVQVELASAAFFDRLDALTTVRLQAPPRRVCPRAARGVLASANDSATGGGAGSADAGVTVLQSAVVGPYQTVTIRADSNDALARWLRENGYAVPPGVEPILSYYNEMRTDFVALRLRPGEGVDAMQPVRVRFATPSPVLPLRMVAAGIADKVGISLFVVGEGRYESQNYPALTIDRSRIVWDWNTNSSNYRSLFDQTLRASQNRGWVTESALPFNAFSASNSFGPGGFQPSFDARSLAEDPDTMGDYRVATRGLSAPWVTRIRTELGAAALDRDLQLGASATDARVEQNYQIQTAVNDTVCPTDDGFYAGGEQSSNGCAVQPSPSQTRSFGGVLLAGLAVTVLARRRRSQG
ncbi:MAG: DUF2330 domain-containing protein [Myxococcales bacterium]|nr:DUF2330 domain-containing protein [Myxococcales bacterium]